MTLAESLTEHYFEPRKTLDRFAVTVNGEHEVSASRELKPGDVVNVVLEHPPIKPDGTPGDTHRTWTFEGKASVDASSSGHWHGHVTAGEVR